MDSSEAAPGPRTSGRVLGVDYGRRRIGLAVSDEWGWIASAWQTVQVQTVEEAVDAVAEAFTRTQAIAIVVGMPYHMHGGRSEMGDEVEGFRERLETRLGLSVETIDERLTSHEAEDVLIEAGVKGQKRKGVIDRLAAQRLLQCYLDEWAEQFPQPPNHEDGENKDGAYGE